MLCNRLVDRGFRNDCIKVVFISNAKKQVPLWNQKDKEGKEFVVWDYHVVLQLAAGGKKFIYDLNTTLPIPCCATFYWTETLNPSIKLPDDYRRLL
ncbi:unnamed protein product [Enterobius vermicularis]|uniref:Protein N-terminal glutamine amidohydrolase n=1 Tax=Enterobius vermicularis TaxID=51028 RepID=A0A0N4UUX0_ENTVE|nr:unnamed protein product [Enterobius vermicularis]